MSTKLIHLVEFCQDTLKPDLFRDYCPNGLQIEGCEYVSHICTAVTSSLQAIEHAVSIGADALLVHHGLFWKGTNPCLVGSAKHRVSRLLLADLSLIAYHLPLDAHPQLGNNAKLAQLLGIAQDKQTKATQLLATGNLPHQVKATSFMENLCNVFGLQVRMFGNSGKHIQRIGWCTGAGGDFFDQAVEAGVDAFITGEVSERHYHLANESGIPLFAAGHHATERYGVQALADSIAAEYSIETTFFDEPNPI